jgi:putative aldouronate transport system permease protein
MEDAMKNRLYKFFLHSLLLVISLACLLPAWLVVSASFTDDKALVKNGYTLIPSQFSTFAYEYILTYPVQILRAYGVTLAVTITGTLLALAITASYAYTLSRTDYVLSKPLAMFTYFPMLFGGGLVAYYLLMTNYLHLKNTLAALVAPYLVIPFYVFMLRSFFKTLPAELLDAARVDGASEFRIFLEIVLPLSKPALATIGLFLILGYWNDYMTALYFINDSKLFPLQYLLYQINASASAIATNPQLAGQPVPLQPVRMAMVVLTTGPAAIAFLLVQKYMVKGLTLGAFK